MPLDFEALKVSLIVAFSAAGSDSDEMSTGGTKRQRLEEIRPAEVDLKLSEELQELMGGRKYIKEEELTRAVLLEWAKRQGAVKEVNLISITVQTMGGTELEVKLDDTANSVSCLKQNIQDGHGIPAFNQQLFLVSKSGDKAEANVEAKQEPMSDTELLVVDCCVALCIDAVEENSWDCSSPLISVSLALCFHFVESDWNCFDFRTR